MLFLDYGGSGVPGGYVGTAEIGQDQSLEHSEVNGRLLGGFKPGVFMTKALGKNNPKWMLAIDQHLTLTKFSELLFNVAF